ncbi:MAG: hypothetical protein K9K86_00760 [Pseudomonadales bacterium]|nr:hypothetical protein [Pseudomonadales bacterium]
MTTNKQENLLPTAPKPKGRLTLIFIFAIAFVPMVLATYMYFNKVMVPSGRTNKGVLILPPLALDELGLTGEENQPIGVADMQDKWVMIVVADSVCGQTCKEALYKARQVNIALHKESERVIRYYVDVSIDGTGALSHSLKSEYPLLHLASADRLPLKRYLDQKLDANKALSESYILLADPIGNVMMYYLPENSGKDILEDLKRLLKVSQIG